MIKYSVMKRLAQQNRKIKIIVLTVVTALYFVGLAVLYAVNTHFSALTDAPAVKQGTTDYKDIDRNGRRTAITLSGEWEFFYNRHIITDGDGGAPDGYLSVPSKWTGKIFNGKKAARSGYASYRLTVKNIKAGEVVTCFSDNSTVALRIFVNGKLCSESGVVGKTADTSVSGQAERIDFVVSDGGDIIVVLETGYTSSGGLAHAPCLSSAMSPNPYWIFLERMVTVALGLILGLFLASVVVTLAFRKYESDGSAPVLIGMLSLHFLFSKDVTKALGLYGYGAVWIPALLTGALTITVFTWRILFLYGGVKTPLAVALGAIRLGAAVSYGIIYGTSYALIPALIFLFSALATLYPLLNSKLRMPYKIVYTLVYFMTVCILTLEVADGAGLLMFGTEYIFTLLLLVPIIAQVVLTVLQLNEKRTKLLRIRVLEAELEASKQKALLLQIKPHFVFNSLTAIQAQYRKDSSAGDIALENFAHFLRANIDAVEGKETIPFDEEVQNVLRYFELQNLRADGALTLLLDLDETAFEVPALSLQPFVENAVKHSGIESAEDGRITLSSKHTKNGILVKITDNGVGFDSDAPHEGVGIRNTAERLSRLSNAEVRIKSAIGSGTEIEILFPAEKQGGSI